MKKNILSVGAVFMTALFIFQSCKKGEEDPFVSLRSRDARIIGEWTLTAYESSDINNTNGTSTHGTTTKLLEGNSMKETFSGTTWMNPSTDTSWTKNYSYSMTLSIKDDGTFSSSETKNGLETKFEGNWVWMDSNKKKSSILLFNGDFYSIVKLSNKELILSYEDYRKEWSGTNTWYEYISSFKLTFSKD